MLSSLPPLPPWFWLSIAAHSPLPCQAIAYFPTKRYDFSRADSQLRRLVRKVCCQILDCVVIFNLDPFICDIVWMFLDDTEELSNSVLASEPKRDLPLYPATSYKCAIKTLDMICGYYTKIILLLPWRPPITYLSKMDRAIHTALMYLSDYTLSSTPRASLNR